MMIRGKILFILTLIASVSCNTVIALSAEQIVRNSKEHEWRITDLEDYYTDVRFRGKIKIAPKGGHSKNIRSSTKSKHEKGDARRMRDQKRASERNKGNRRRGDL